MGQNIAGPQFRNHPLQNRVGVFAIGAALGQAPERAEMHIKRQIGAAADLGRHFQNLDAPAREAADLGVAFDAAHDVFVGVRRLDGRVDIDAGRAVEIGVVVALEAADQISREESINLRRACSTMKCRKPGSVMHDGPPWSITVVTPERTPTMSGFKPKRPVTY